ncbi:MAG: VWA domain-containing protein [Saprospiraceae bacterium]
MFRFEHSVYLYGLAFIPILVLFFVATWYYRKRALNRFGNPELLQHLMPEWSKYKHTVKFILLLSALSLLVVGWANPQWGSKKEKVKRKGIDVFIALDVSRSMLAQDISPSRLDRSKRFAQNLVDQLKGENLGVILFACNAYLQVPLTNDYAFAHMFVSTANPGMATSQGTAIGEAISLAEQSFPEENQKHKALIIISDGEDHDGEAVANATVARENGLLVFTIGVGDAQGSFIPVNQGGREDYLRDRSGNPVRSQLNEEMLKDVAKAGGGDYFNLLNGSEEVMNALKVRIDAIEKREMELRSFTEYESYFQYFIGLGLFLIILEFVLSYRKNRYLGDKDLFGA